jgi:hypothetical protein
MRLLPACILAFFISQSVYADADPHAGLGLDAFSDASSMNDIMKMTETPVGVVFDVYSSDDATLQWALPEIQQHVKDLRDKFPGIRLAIVSHGLEELSLMKQYDQDYPDVHVAGKELTKAGDIPLHVDGQFAIAHGVAANQFLEFVTVSDSGQQQVETYKNEGYLRVLIAKKFNRDSCPGVFGVPI